MPAVSEGINAFEPSGRNATGRFSTHGDFRHRFVRLRVDHEHLAVGFACDVDKLPIGGEGDSLRFVLDLDDGFHLAGFDIEQARGTSVLVRHIEVLTVGADRELLWVGPGGELLHELAGFQVNNRDTILGAIAPFDFGEIGAPFPSSFGGPMIGLPLTAT